MSATRLVTTNVWSQRHGGDSRGGAPARRQSKRALLALYGDGERCACVHCGCELTFKTLTRDRREPGGSYALHNLQPACIGCNRKRSNNRDWTPDNTTTEGRTHGNQHRQRTRAQQRTRAVLQAA